MTITIKGISATIVADSVSMDKRLTTMVCRYPRFIHSEVMTHRVFSRNAASSRAIPVKKMIEQVMTDPAMPVWWGKNQPGMQAKEQLEGDALEKAKKTWLLNREVSVRLVEGLMEIGLHKQVANRILEPWMYMVTLISATEWENFFNLRRHPDAQPEMKVLADAMFEARAASVPASIGIDDWHLPFVRLSERDQPIETLRKYSVARCARVSYLNHDGTNPDPVKDIALHDMLLQSGHMSPFEHQARPRKLGEFDSNFIDWTQYRKLIPNEAVFKP